MSKKTFKMVTPCSSNLKLNINKISKKFPMEDLHRKSQEKNFCSFFEIDLTLTLCRNIHFGREWAHFEELVELYKNS